MKTVTHEIIAEIRTILEAEYNRRQIVGNKSLESAFTSALRSSPVREAISDALDIFIG